MQDKNSLRDYQKCAECDNTTADPALIDEWKPHAWICGDCQDCLEPVALEDSHGEGDAWLCGDCYGERREGGAA